MQEQEQVHGGDILTELLLEGQDLRTVLQLKTVVTEKIIVGDAQVPMGVREESC